jgi:tetratricopeptide (TPR) repeat protein
MDVANENTVLGDFDDAEFTHLGVSSRFYRRDGRYFVYTNGPGGEMGEFEITHTFGWFPLQQYLVPFPGGRLQTLPLAWDSRDNHWFRVAGEEPVDPDDWLYWANAAQNWNGMCAQCHSTNLKKNYDIETDTYNTTWSDIDVGCEACHGPGSRHVEWAEMPEMGRPVTWNSDLVRKTSDIGSREHVELCAPCHSRRGSMGDDAHQPADLLDNYLPSLLSEDLYFADGQILEEVYVYGSFTQSKMYRHDVRCSDCHEVHSIELVKEGNELCLQCHREDQYDTAQHHFHKFEGEEGEPVLSAEGEVLFEVGSGAECVQCHMPGRYYMGPDYRPDHSFRIPDPALAAEIGAPDSCLRCHVDKDAAWSQQTVTEWYGPGRTKHYGYLIARARAGEPGLGPDLAKLSMDTLYPVLVRATALSLLTAYPGAEAAQAMAIAMMDEEARLRRAAVEYIQADSAEQLAKTLAPMLYDPVKTVRIEAARRLAEGLSGHLDASQRKVYDVVIEEYESAMKYSGDFAFARHNLANLYTTLDRPEEAMRHYEAAIRIDGQFYPAKVNLAMAYNRQGRNDEAERLLREVVTAQPELHEVAYSYALLLVELRRFDEAATYLQRAADGLPGRPRIRYNLGLLYQQLRQLELAERELSLALEADGRNFDFQYALLDHYLTRGMFEQGRPIAEAMASMHPQNTVGMQALEYIRQATGR